MKFNCVAYQMQINCKIIHVEVDKYILERYQQIVQIARLDGR